MAHSSVASPRSKVRRPSGTCIGTPHLLGARTRKHEDLPVPALAPSRTVVKSTYIISDLSLDMRNTVDFSFETGFGRETIHGGTFSQIVSILPVDFRFRPGIPYTRFSKNASRVQSYRIGGISTGSYTKKQPGNDPRLRCYVNSAYFIRCNTPSGR